MNYENWISYRYLVASKGRFLTFLNIISIAGVAIGVMSLIVVLGIMTGFGNNLREKIIGTTPHVMIEKETGIRDFNQIREKLKTIESVKGSAAYVQGNLFLEESEQAIGLVLRGIDPNNENQVTRVGQYLEKGSLADLDGATIFIGKELARYFGFALGDEITLISPSTGISEKVWRYKLKIGGIFATGVSDYDMNLVITSLSKAQDIFGFAPDMCTGIGVQLKNPYKAKQAKKEIYDLIGYSYMVKTWIDINRNLFEALFLEKWGMFIILSLMILVAAFNIVSTLIVTISSKIHDIGILKAIGVPKRSIRKIFVQQGIFIGLLGTFWGVLGGVSICYLLATYVKVPEQIYSIDHVPIDLQPFDMLMIISAALIITYISAIYPSVKAANLQPVEALRYE